MINILFLSVVSFLLVCHSNNNSKRSNTNAVIKLNENKNMDFDFLDAYKLKLGNTPLFGRYDSFVINLGLPNKVTVFKTDYSIESKTDLEKLYQQQKIRILLHFTIQELICGIPTTIV
jgi:hypothetical protein